MIMKIDKSVMTLQGSDNIIQSDNATLCEDELVNHCEDNKTILKLSLADNNICSLEPNSSSRMRMVFGILVRLVLPLASGVARGIKDMSDVGVLCILQNIACSRHALTNLVAYAANTLSLNLSSVQVSNRIGPLLQLLKLRKTQDGFESLSDTIGIVSDQGFSMPSTPSIPNFFHESQTSSTMFSIPFKTKTTKSEVIAPNCCSLNILAEPPPNTPIRADIVFIHGLHGSLKNTWKQGVWANERQPVEFKRPPQPPVRPPKRPRYSRSSSVYRQPSTKRAKYSYSEQTTVPIDENLFEKNNQETIYTNYAYICGEPREVEVSEGIEYSFPSFRFRINDHSKRTKIELYSMVDGITNQQTRNTSILDSQKNKKNQTFKLTQDQSYSKCWPGDWLPLDCPGVRVIALNYTTDQYLWRPIWKNKESRSNLIQRSREMSELLIKHRVGFGHPIVYVGHSKGGLFIKQIIVDAWENGKTTPLWRSARGAFFYSVPHRGSHLASIKAPLLLRSVELLDIEKNNKYLLDLHRRFVGLYHLGYLKIEVFSFVETALTLMSVLYLRIVGVDSADPGIGDVCGIRLDHREICKPRNRDCLLYKELVKMINRVC